MDTHQTQIEKAFAYHGEGPEIGQVYKHVITGFVVHEDVTMLARLKTLSGRAWSASIVWKTSLLNEMRRRVARDSIPPRGHVIDGKRFSLPLIVKPSYLSRTRFRARRWIGQVSELVRLDFSLIGSHALKIQSFAVVASVAFIAQFHLLDLAPQGDPTEIVSELRLDAKPDLDDALTTASIAEASKSDEWKTARGKTLPIFALEAPELAGLVQNYTGRVKTSGPREDILTFDEPNLPSGTAFRPLVLVVAQRHNQDDAAPSLYVETVRRAALHGVSIMRSYNPSEVQSRFGPLEVADVVLSLLPSRARSSVLALPSGNPNHRRSCI